MPLHEDSRACTPMTTPLGPMQWKAVPMGAKNGNVVFQRVMEDLLGPVQDCADPFVDDIIIGSGTEDMSEDELIKAHKKDSRRVLDVLDRNQIICKPTKASLFVKEVEFAGHVVGHGQRRPVPGKLAALNIGSDPAPSASCVRHGILQLLFGLRTNVCRTLGTIAQNAAGWEV